MNEGKNKARMRFYHPSAKGTGCALSLELLPASGDAEGCIMVRFAKQLTTGDRQAPVPTYPTFNWEAAIAVKLGFSDLCQILQVLRGECENIEEGRGLIHRSLNASTKINFRHLIEPVQGYVFEVHRVANKGRAENKVMIIFTPWEALGLAESIAGSMSAICVGIPNAGNFGQGAKKTGSANEAA